MASATSELAGLAIGVTEEGTPFAAASLTIEPGVYPVVLTVEGKDGETREVRIVLTVDPLERVPSGWARPPVIVLNGWQASCPASFSDTFGDRPWEFLGDVPKVYWFDYCTQCKDCSIEELGDNLGDVLSRILFENGAPVPQFDLVAHSMGGLIVRSYLAGLKADRRILPPPQPKVRKMVQIGTPNFGSHSLTEGIGSWFKGIQRTQMTPGSDFLWRLATWNQGGDDLRGVDALAIVGNKGTLPAYPNGSWPSASDGIVSVTSGAIGFAREASRTRVLPLCHTDPDFLNRFVMSCEGDGLAKAEVSWRAIQAFLSNNPAGWQIGSSATVLHGGVFVGIDGPSTLTPPYTKDLAEFTAAGSSILDNSGGLYYRDFLPAGNALFDFTSSSLGQWLYARSIPGGTFRALRLKPGPFISSVGPLFNRSAWVVQSSGSITIRGYGFGSRCGSCRVDVGSLSNLPVISWSDTEISVSLPPQTGYLPVTVTASTGRDRTYIMAEPAPVTVSFNSSPSGLAIRIDGTNYTTPFSMNRTPGSSISIQAASPQTLGTGSRAVFTSWSDGGAAARSITVGPSAATYVATFTSQHLVTRFVSPAGAGSIVATPSSVDGFYNQGSAIQFTAAASTGYQFSGFTGNLTGTANPTSFSVTAPGSITANFGCTFQLSATALNVPATAGNASFSVLTGAGCIFSAASSAPWLVPSVTGSAVSLSYVANAGAARSATITVGGQTFTVNQAASTQAAPPPTVSASGNVSGAGMSQTLTFRFSHPQGFQQLDVVNALINVALDGGRACYIAYSQPARILFLVNDGGPEAGLSTPLTLGGSGSVSNGQCTISSAGSSAVGAGNDLTLILNISFKSNFEGNKVIYLAARDSSGGNSGWQTMGVSMVPETTTTFPRSSDTGPVSGQEATRVVSFSYSDSSASTNLQTAWALINSALDGGRACYVAFFAPANLLLLIPDNVDGAAATAMGLSGTSTLENSQCLISSSGSSVVRNGNQLTLNLNITFKPSFAGSKGVWTAVQTLSGQTSRWKAVGTWQVPK